MGDKKSLYIRTDQVGTYSIQYEGGGQQPAALSGTYTRKKFAEKALEDFLKIKEEVKSKPKKSIVKPTEVVEDAKDSNPDS